MDNVCERREVWGKKNENGTERLYKDDIKIKKDIYIMYNKWQKS